MDRARCSLPPRTHRRTQKAVKNTTTTEDRILDSLESVRSIVERLDQEITDLEAALKQVREENKELEQQIEELKNL
jgi:peptidoglycan hydrolase CwlO-like protein